MTSNRDVLLRQGESADSPWSFPNWAYGMVGPNADREPPVSPGAKITAEMLGKRPGEPMILRPHHDPGAFR